MSGLVGILLSVLGFISVVDKNGIVSIHHVLNVRNKCNFKHQSQG